MWKRWAAAAVVIGGLGACEERPATSNPGFFSKGSSEVRIESLELHATHLVGEERFEVSYAIPAAGSQLIAKYGLKTRLGETIHDVKPPLPVVNGGKARMWVGPLTNLKEGGKLDVEFWVLDDQGRESNRLTGEVTIQ